ncbi:hypothetical protein, partial [Candidatus Thiosymbion oneisti]|uniref:hypothetical protein n=1 Tax=Candidatus Thiosymbion oneisti TaxID=589554 RepID=UPI001C40515D
PLQTLKHWYAQQPRLFNKIPRNHPGHDIRVCCNISLGFDCFGIEIASGIESSDFHAARPVKNLPLPNADVASALRKAKKVNRPQNRSPHPPIFHRSLRQNRPKRLK